MKLPFQLAGKEGTPGTGTLWGEGKGAFLTPTLEHPAPHSWHSLEPVKAQRREEGPPLVMELAAEVKVGRGGRPASPAEGS